MKKLLFRFKGVFLLLLVVLFALLTFILVPIEVIVKGIIEIVKSIFRDYKFFWNRYISRTFMLILKSIIEGERISESELNWPQKKN